MKAVLIPGDGIGKEIAQSVCRAGDALGADIDWQIFEAGAEYANKTGLLLEPGLTDALAAYRLALKGPTATPVGKGFRSINVQLRRQFQTYANLRPVRSIPGVKSRYTGVDLVIIRENTEDLYQGLEMMEGPDTAKAIKLITRGASERICRFAFEYARSHARKKVTAVHKANILKLTDGLFLDSFRKISAGYPDIQADSVIVDALCLKLVTDPGRFDVIVAPNLYGDIISDLAAGLIGGLGFAPSANIGDQAVIYEAVHGSAPDIAGKGIANPSALLMAFAMLLDDNGMADKSSSLRRALEDVTAEGFHTTPDVGGTAGTREFTDAVISRIGCGGSL